MNWAQVIAYTLTGAAFLAVLGAVGSMDYADELRAAVHYCDMVAAGSWPDYDNVAQYCPETYATAAEHFPDYTPPEY